MWPLQAEGARSPWRRGARRGALALALGLAMTVAASAAGPRTALVPFEVSPFPYAGAVPGQDKPFLDAVAGERRGHTSPRGGVYWSDETYSDKRVLLAVPPQFNPSRPGYIVVFFHGNKARLERDVVRRQRVVQQLAASGLNAVLVAPQFAVDALDSSAGRFWEPGVFAAFLDEAATRLGSLAAGPFHTMPVILVAYSGGYMPASAVLDVGGAGDRIAGVVLLDAAYGELDTFAAWIARTQGRSFFFSAYSKSTKAENAGLQQRLDERHVVFSSGLPQRIQPRTISFLDAGSDVVHNDFVTRAWTADPLRAVLARVK